MHFISSMDMHVPIDRTLSRSTDINACSDISDISRSTDINACSDISDIIQINGH